MTTSHTTSGVPSPRTTGSDHGAREHAQEAAGTAAAEGRHVASTAKDEARRVADEAGAHARSLLSEATGQVEEQSRAQKDRLAETVRTFGDDLDRMATDGDGLAADVAREVAERARTVSGRLRDREPRELLDDVRDFARRRPGTFLLGALTAGVVAGRLARGTKEAQSNDTGPGTDGPVGTVGAAPPADVTSPADPLSTGRDAPSSGAVAGGISETGTATGDPLAGTRSDLPPAPGQTQPAPGGAAATEPSEPGGRS